MKLQSLRWLCVIALPTCIAASLPASASDRELLIKWRDGPASAEAAAANAAMGSQVVRSFPFLGWQWVRLPEGLSLTDGMARYRRLDSVLIAEPNRKVPLAIPPVDVVESGSRLRPAAEEPAVIPNDPRFAEQWYLRKIGATNAWATTTGSTHVVVAVLDTGVDYTHPDLAANMWRNPGETGLDGQGNDKATNGLDDDQNGYVDDVHGIDAPRGTGDPAPGHTDFIPEHGTAVAGIIAAVGNNGEGITGVNWSSQIMAIQIWPESFVSLARHTESILAGLDYIIQMKKRGVNVRVMNCGFAIGWHSAALRDALITAGSEGILAVFPAYNFATNLDLFSAFPAAVHCQSGICVAASTESDALAWFSCYGSSTVDLAAPGVRMITPWISPQYISDFDGTSGACPLVSGAAALLLSQYPTLTITDLKAALLGSVDPSPGLKGKVITHGRLNIAAALEYLASRNANPPPAIVVHASPAGQWTSPEAPIKVTFNRPMSRSSVENAFSIHPPIEGSFAWDEDNRAFSFHHELPFDATTNYTVRILGTAQDEAGGALDGNFDRIRENSASDDFVWTFRFPIPNDDFAKAQPLAGPSGSLSARNAFAWVEIGEPIFTFGDPFQPDGTVLYGGSLWYRWTPETSGWASFDLTVGTAFDSLLAVFTGDNLDSLRIVATNDNHGTRLASRVSFEAKQGTSYSVLVATKADTFDSQRIVQGGNFRLTWYPTPPPGFTGSRFSPMSAAPGREITLTGTNFTGATAVLFNGVPGSFTNAAGNNHDLRITAVVPPGALPGPITVVTPHGNATTTASFQVLPPPLSLRFLSNGEAQLHWNATGDFFVVEHSHDLFGWQVLEYLPEIGPEHSTLTLPFNFQSQGFFRLRTRPE